ncbi:MAG TPA: hypothetical protein VFF00_05845 [Candidatus Elarobacter sp.]|nr:hypothetical protein [Candidatus Elarobacter sp.]
MRRISITLSDADLALIDAAASPDRNSFIVAAAKEAAQRADGKAKASHEALTRSKGKRSD